MHWGRFDPHHSSDAGPPPPPPQTTGLEEDSVDVVAQSLVAPPYLRRLGMQGCVIADCATFGVRFSKISGLCELDLSGATICGAAALAAALPRLTALEALALAAIDSAGDPLDGVTASLVHLPNLTCLDLSGMQQPAAAAAALAGLSLIHI